MDANELLMRGGVPAAKFPAIGTVVRGTIMRDPEARQVVDPKTKEPEFWKDGPPKMQVVVALSTSERDPAEPDDTGDRTLYIKGQMQAAVRDAVRKTGAAGLEIGGEIVVQYTADGPRTGRLDPPKVYAAWYTRPPAVGNSALMSAPPATSPVPAFVAPPAAPPAPSGPANVLATLTPEMAAQLRELGFPVP